MRARTVGAALGAVLVAALGATSLTSCGSEPEAVRIVSAGQLVSLDPTATVDATSRGLMAQLYPLLLQRDARTGVLETSLADSAEFTAPDEYTVTIPSGLEFANGDTLTSSDVVFSFQRMLELGVESGPGAQLEGVRSVEATDEQTVVFHLATANDASFPSALASPAGVIVDEEVFAADATTSDEVIVDAQPFAGPFRVGEVTSATAMTLVANPHWVGEPPGAATIELELGVDPEEAAHRLMDGSADVVWGTLPNAVRESLADASGVRVISRPSRSLRMLVFDLATMPFGAATDQADAAKAAAVRRAVADLVDRDALAEAAPGQWIGWAGFLPETLGGSADPIATTTGDGTGGPSASDATSVLAAAGVTTPVPLTFSVGLRDGEGGPDALTEALVAQLETGGLFDVTIAPHDGPFTKAVLTENHFPAFEFRWSPLGNDPDDYLTALYGPESELANNAVSADLNAALAAEATLTDPDERAAAILEIQQTLAQRLTTIPLVQRLDSAFVGPRITGGAISGRGHLDFASLLLT
ncbi:MAG: hypothetical protein J0G30_08660 [Actinomycetales bacterium]|nr:hypothetical protein [Actinomycetales bacterium]